MTTLFILFLVSVLGFILGLIRPQLFKWLRKKTVTRKYLSFIFGSLSIIFLVLIGSFVKPVSTNKESHAEQYYQVVSVVDGDTIKVNIDGETTTLRLIGMDTPETVDPRKPVQCFGQEASAKAKELLEGKKVRLEADTTQGELDKYNRLLRYVFLEDRTFYNKVMIAEGYANEYTYESNPYKYQTEFKAAQTEAREQSKGLWSPLNCNGDTTKPAITVTPVSDNEPRVKKSSTGICHEKGSTYYLKTKNFIAFNSIEECINSGGRLPKR